MKLAASDFSMGIEPYAIEDGKPANSIIFDEDIFNRKHHDLGHFGELEPASTFFEGSVYRKA